MSNSVTSVNSMLDAPVLTDHMPVRDVRLLCDDIRDSSVFVDACIGDMFIFHNYVYMITHINMTRYTDGLTEKEFVLTLADYNNIHISPSGDAPPAPEIRIRASFFNEPNISLVNTEACMELQEEPEEPDKSWLAMLEE